MRRSLTVSVLLLSLVAGALAAATPATAAPVSRLSDYPNLAAAFDNAGVSPAANPGAANLDGTGHSLIAEDLAAAGWNPGAKVTVNGTPLQFPTAAPGTPDNVIANGQRITLHGSGTALSFLVTSTGTATSGSGVVDYADGTSQSYQLAAPDWYVGPTDAKTVSAPRWNAPGGPAAATMKLYTLVVPLRAGVSVVRVTLPKVSDSVNQPTMHVFALGIRPSAGPWKASWANGIDDSLAPWTWTDRTLRMVEHTSTGGSAVRIHLDNSFGPAPITVGHATIAVQKSGAQPTNAPVTLTFGGAQSVTMPSGGQAVSDGLRFAVPADTNLLVTLYLKGAVTYASMHSGASQDMYSTNDGTGDHAADGANFPVNNLFGFWTVLSGIDVSGGAGASVVAFGDSITDGYNSSQNSNSRWPNFLARRLPSGPAVVDEGISGNRILTDAFTGMPNTGTAGVSALSRLDRDLVAQSGVRTAIVLEGINDINNTATTADQVIAGLKQMAATIHAAHLRVLVGTLTPIAGCGCSNDQHIAYRDQVNAFIRANGGVFDGVVDFDAAVRDPANLEAMLAAYDSGDHLHPNDAGYQAMANAVPLSAL
ncbi:SGNH/GDSL hydrolase family protein [Kutzneria sp. CA-103260]|uniref:SGNH/GDSL hydrolase family protein n=1 Tax=Kutzneria sp. CA-103260 TaxID=2802641 RepID=UPI001BA9474E|nr:SGNH/GDSL hydrolase family protein [Kutzneria sp. CA-103260]QUQ63958.1 SGNH/GDSL hydrolase family protein [Kutzneria sp. CA-103260]